MKIRIFKAMSSTAMALVSCKSQPNLRRPQLLAAEEERKEEEEPRSHTLGRSAGRSSLTSVKASKKDQTNSGGQRYGSRRGN